MATPWRSTTEATNRRTPIAAGRGRESSASARDAPDLARAHAHGVDVGLLALRLTAGGLLFGHAAQNLFGWFGAEHRPSDVEQFDAMGYRPARFFARAAGIAELLASASLVTGGLTPVGGMLTAATTAQAVQSAKWRFGLWEEDGGYEYLLLLGVSGAALAFAGPGRYAVDRAVRTDMSGVKAGLVAAAAAAVSLGLPHRLPGHGETASSEDGTGSSDDVGPNVPSSATVPS